MKRSRVTPALAIPSLMLVPLLALLLQGALGLPGDDATRNVFEAKDAHGQVWVSVRLTRFRTDQTFIPLLVAVRNVGRATTTLDRSAFQLVAADGETVPMATVEQVREGYPMLLFDETAVRFTGLPLGTVLDLSDLEPSDLFPTAAGPGKPPVSESVTLAPGRWTVDLLYFPRPAGLVENQTVSLEVQGTGWNQPVSVPFHL